MRFIWNILTGNFNIANVLPQRKFRPLTLAEENDILTEKIREANEAAEYEAEATLLDGAGEI